MQEGCFGKYIAVLHRQEQKYVNRVMKRYDLGYSCYNFLLYLSRKEGASQKALCTDMVIDEALAARVMKKLEAQDYVRREKPAGGRTYRLFLTEKGQALVPVLREAVSGWWEKLTADWDDAHRVWFLAELPAMAAKAGKMIDGAGEE